MPSVAGFFLSRHLMWRCLWRHLDLVEMIEVLVVSALDSPGLFEGPFEAVFEKFLVPPTERLPWQCSPYSSCLVSLLSGILETWPAHLTKAFCRRVCTLGCWPFLWPPAIWCGGICVESSGGNDWAAWRVCYRQFKRRGEWCAPMHGKPSEILTESLEGDAGLSYPVAEFSVKVHLSWRCTTQVGEVRNNCLWVLPLNRKYRLINDFSSVFGADGNDEVVTALT